MLSLPRPLASRGAGDVVVAASAWVLLGASRAALQMVRFETLMRVTGFRLVDDASDDATPLTAPTSGELRQLSWGIGAAAARTPWTSACLAQALTGATLLRVRREPVRLYLGVRPAKSEEGRDMTAHAWLVSRGQVVTGDSGRDQYGVVAVFEGGSKGERFSVG